MSNALRAKLLSIRADIDAALAEIPSDEPASPALSKVEPRWMRLGAYAAARSFSRRTLHTMITEGLPTTGDGKGRRVVVADADTWLSKRAPRAKKVANG